MSDMIDAIGKAILAELKRDAPIGVIPRENYFNDQADNPVHSHQVQAVAHSEYSRLKEKREKGEAEQARVQTEMDALRAGLENYTTRDWNQKTRDLVWAHASDGNCRSDIEHIWEVTEDLVSAILESLDE